MRDRPRARRAQPRDRGGRVDVGAAVADVDEHLRRVRAGGAGLPARRARQSSATARFGAAATQKLAAQTIPPSMPRRRAASSRSPRRSTSGANRVDAAPERDDADLVARVGQVVDEPVGGRLRRLELPRARAAVGGSITIDRDTSITSMTSSGVARPVHGVPTPSPTGRWIGSERDPRRRDRRGGDDGVVAHRRARVRERRLAVGAGRHVRGLRVDAGDGEVDDDAGRRVAVGIERGHGERLRRCRSGPGCRSSRRQRQVALGVARRDVAREAGRDRAVDVAVAILPGERRDVGHRRRPARSSGDRRLERCRRPSAGGGDGRRQ